MADLSTAATNLMIDWLTVVGTPTRPTGFYLALFTTTPTDLLAGSGGTEATGGSYARIEVTMDTAASRATTNTSGPHEFVVGTNCAAATYKGYGIYSASSGGVYLGGASLSADRVLANAGDKISFAVGDIDLSLPSN